MLGLWLSCELQDEYAIQSRVLACSCELAHKDQSIRTFFNWMSNTPWRAFVARLTFPSYFRFAQPIFITGQQEFSSLQPCRVYGSDIWWWKARCEIGHTAWSRRYYMTARHSPNYLTDAATEHIFRDLDSNKVLAWIKYSKGGRGTVCLKHLLVNNWLITSLLCEHALAFTRRRSAQFK